MDNYIFDIVKDLIDTKVRLAELELKVNILKRMVEAEEVESVENDIKYGVGDRGKRVTGDLDTKDIREIFGWEVTPEALDIVKKYNDGLIKKEDLSE